MSRIDADKGAVCQDIFEWPSSPWTHAPFSGFACSWLLLFWLPSSNTLPLQDFLLNIDAAFVAELVIARLG